VISDVATHCAQDAVKGSNKRRKQRLQGTTTITNCDDGHDWEVGGSDVRCILATARSDKRLTRPPKDHFKGLLEEASQNHTYPISHKLKDYNTIRSFMTSGSLTWCHTPKF
jgi:hypothetical protein